MSCLNDTTRIREVIAAEAMLAERQLQEFLAISARYVFSGSPSPAPSIPDPSGK